MIQSIDTRLRKINSALLIACFCLLPLVSSASVLSTDPEKVLEFADHLYQTEDYLRAAIEYERYLYLSGMESDSIQFKIGLCHQFRNRSDYAIEAFSKIQGTELQETARTAILYNHYLLENWDAILEISCRNDTEYFFHYLASLQLDSVNTEPEYFEKINDDSLRSALLTIDNDRNQYKTKSPLFAAVMSAVIPGLGKAYLRRPGDTLYALGMTGFAGIVSWEAFKAELLITGIITSGITLSFYLGTIYGSYVGTMIYNESLNDTIIGQLEQYNPVIANPYWSAW